MPATDEEYNKHAALQGVFIDNIGEVVKFLSSLDKRLYDAGNPFYINGDIEVRHSDGWIAGYIKSYEDNWVFIPDAKEFE